VDLMFDIVKKVIDEYDPDGLLSFGAPNNEYDLESRKIATRIKNDSSNDEIAIICSEVFSQMFSYDFQKKDFIDIANDIKMYILKYNS
jgi:hypothetical protein